MALWASSCWCRRLEVLCTPHLAARTEYIQPSERGSLSEPHARCNKKGLQQDTQHVPALAHSEERVVETGAA